MFTLTCEMDLFDFDNMGGFWSGARDRWDHMSTEEKNCLNNYAEGCEFTSLTQVNDFVWFDSDEILEEARASLQETEDDEIEEENEEEG